MSMRKALCAVLCVLLYGMTFPALAEISLYPESTTLYMGCKNGTDYEATAKINVQGLESAIWLDMVRSSNDSVLSVEGVEMAAYRSETRDSGDYIYARNSADIVLVPRGAGSATLTLTVGGKRHSVKLSVAPYVNPVKRFVLTGATEKNLKALFDDSSFVEKPLSRSVDQGVLSIEAASGWRVTRAEWYCYNEAEVYSCEWSSGVPTMQMLIPAMQSNREYLITAEFMNEKTHGRIVLLLQI